MAANDVPFDGVRPGFSCATAVEMQPANRENPMKVRTAKPANRPLERRRFESIVTLSLVTKVLTLYPAAFLVRRQ
jgi:hypothetical protein